MPVVGRDCFRGGVFSNVKVEGANEDGGEAGIRTLGGDKPSTVFKTAAFDHSATSPIGDRIPEFMLFLPAKNHMN